MGSILLLPNDERASCRLICVGFRRGLQSVSDVPRTQPTTLLNNTGERRGLEHAATRPHAAQGAEMRSKVERLPLLEPSLHRSPRGSYGLAGANSPAKARSCTSQGDTPALRAAIILSGSTNTRLGPSPTEAVFMCSVAVQSLP
jgi:hypothetical protein